MRQLPSLLEKTFQTAIRVGMAIRAEAGISHGGAATGAVGQVFTIPAKRKIAQGNEMTFPETGKLRVMPPDLAQIIPVDAADLEMRQQETRHDDAIAPDPQP